MTPVKLLSHSDPNTWNPTDCYIVASETPQNIGTAVEFAGTRGVVVRQATLEEAVQWCKIARPNFNFDPTRTRFLYFYEVRFD